MFKAKSIIFAFLILAIFTALFLSAYNSEAALVGNTNQATLSVSPQTGSYNANDNFTVSIYLNTNGQDVVVVAAYLNYDKAHFEVTSIDTTNSAFSIEAEKIIDSTNGVIKITRGNPTSSHINSSNALVAVINFKAVSGVSPSTDNLSFQFTAGSTSESNVIKDDGLGTDILSGVYNGEYTITGGTADTQAPTVTAFSIPSTSTILTVPISSFTATDNIAVIGYIITESSAAPSASASGWSSSAPTSYTFSSAGSKTLYAWAKDAAGNISVSRSATVSISTSDTTSPTVSSVTSSSITNNSATITWTTNENSDSQVEYGLTTSYGSQTTLNTSMVTSHSQSLTGLSANTLYHYRVKSKDAASNLATSGDYTFTTTAAADTTPPTVSSVNSSSITNNSATITWTTNENSDSQVEYGPTTSYGSQTTLNTSIVIAHSVLLSNLNPSAVYHYRVKSKDSANNQATSADYTFTTSTASSLSVSLTANPSSGNAPLSGVDLTATVSGNVSGNTNYSFYCNRSDTGTNVTTGYTTKYDNIPQTTITVTDTCTYNTAGTYIAKVIVERGSYQAEARITITVSAITTPTAPTVPTAPPSGPASSANLLRASTDTKVFEIISSKLRHWIPNPTVFNAYGFSWSSIKVVSNEEVNKYFRVKLLRAQGDVKVYYLTETGQIRHIPNPEIFNSYNNKWEEIITVSQTEINSYPISSLIRLENGTKVYKLENNTKRWIETAEAFNRLKYDWTKIAPVNQTELNYYPEGATIK